MKKKYTLIGLGILIFVLLLGNLVSGKEKSKEKITLRFMHYWGDTDADASAKYLKEILENEFPEKFPNVELVQEIYDNQTYKTKIKVLMAADEEPDIMFGYGAGFSENFVNAGKLLALDAYMDDFYKEHMIMDLQENFVYGDQMYGVCMSYWTGVLYCNKALFEQIDAPIPTTYEELLEVCRQFRESGIEPLACGILDKWQTQMYINNFTMQLGGADLYKSMAHGELDFHQDAFTKAVELTMNLLEAESFSSDMYQLDSNEAEENFLNGEAAMIYMGSWYTSLAEERLGENLEVVKMPTVPGAVESGDYHGGGINGWMVASNTEYPELATEIVSWLAYRLSCYQPENATFVIQEGDQMTEMSETSQKVLDLYPDKKNGGVAWDTLMRSDQTNIWLDACAKLYEGKLDEDEFINVLNSQIK